MDIIRINNYSDARFRKAVLQQHGAFLADGWPCEFEITGADSAVLSYHDYSDEEALSQIIDEFRFYAGHLSRIFDCGGKLLKEFLPVDIFSVEVERIQPSQFYVDEDKMQAVASFVRSSEDIVIPLLYDGGKDTYISLDGHTRLVLALERGYASVRGFLGDGGDYIGGFVEEARRRGVFGVKDIQRLPHEQYDVQWNKFCDTFFARAGEEQS